MEIPVNDVQFDDSSRQRKEIDEESLQELQESFKNIGQITPIVITREHRLVAGRRRLEVARRLALPTIRAEYLDNLSPLDQKIVEFDENDKRKQLSWQEKANAVKEIHELKVAEVKADPNIAGRIWTAADTARTLGRSLTNVSEDLLLASSLGNARVARRPTRRGALDTVKRERELTLVRELARRRASSLGLGDNTLKTTNLTGGVIYNEDCRTVLREMSPNSVDLIVTDPPWGIDFDKASQWTHKWVATYDDAEVGVREMLVEAIPLLFKVLKPSCHLYCFFPIQEIQWWVDQFTSAGFIVRQRSLIWFKTGQPGISDVYTSFLPSYEAILWMYKPGVGDVRRLFARTSGIPEAQGWPRESTVWHENSKPIDMLKSWMEASSTLNEIILDPFSGGGSTLAAASDFGGYYIGVEKDTINYNKSVDRLRQLEERKEDEKIEGLDDE